MSYPTLNFVQIYRFLLTALLLGLVTSTQARPFNYVVIDPGHGGHDRGGNYGKVYEKHLALDTAFRLERYLKEKGIKTRVTRRSDYFITLGKRVSIGNSYPNSIFVSIHYNYTYKRNVKGLETFYCTSKSKPLASEIQRGMLKKVKCVNRGVKFARYHVIRRAKNPAVLVECGFVSNYSERKRMKKGWYRQAMAEGIGNGIISYQKKRRRGLY